MEKLPNWWSRLDSMNTNMNVIYRLYLERWDDWTMLWAAKLHTLVNGQRSN